MRAYESQQAAYFATPSPQLVHALHTALTQILSRPLAERFALHHAASQRVKDAVSVLGLRQLAAEPDNQANGMTAFYLPDGVAPADVLRLLADKGVVLAG